MTVIDRRKLLARMALSATSAGMLPYLAGRVSAGAPSDYKALVVLFLHGGNDGHNTLVPMDGAYSDYERSRQNLAIPRADLLALPGQPDGRSFGMHPNLGPLVDRYSRQRLAFIANVGPLVEPATGRQVRDRAVKIPPFLFSHSDQTLITQGWIPSRDASGWAGRGLEALPPSLVHKLQAVCIGDTRTLVQGASSAVASFSMKGESWWGVGGLEHPEEFGIQTLRRLAQLQSMNDYEAEYARTVDEAMSDAAHFVDVYRRATLPSGDFSGLNELQNLAAAMPIFKADGLRRQVFVHTFGKFDTHANQRARSDWTSSENKSTQDCQLGQVAQALAAFDQANVANGLGDSVLTLVMSEFGRTIRPSSGAGSEHGWGNHWMLMGGAVRGGTVHGRFPSLVLGSDDDGDDGASGRLVPNISSDQVGATLMLWMGMQAQHLLNVFPLLADFDEPTVPGLLA